MPAFVRRGSRAGHRGHRHIQAPRDPAAVEHARGDGHGNGDRNAVEDRAAQVAAQQLRGRRGRRVGRHQRMGDGERRQHGQPIEQQRALGFARQVPHHRGQDDHAHLEEDRQPYQEGGHQHGPRGALGAEPLQQPIRQRAAAARILQVAADHGAQPDHHGDEAQGVAEARLNGFQHLVGRHSGGEAQRHAGEQQRQEGMQFDHQDQKKQHRDGGQGQNDEERAIGGHEAPILPARRDRGHPSSGHRR